MRGAAAISFCSAISGAPDLVLRVARSEIDSLGLLRLVGMARPGVDPEVAHLLASERSARDHPLNRLVDCPLRMLAAEDLAHRALLDAARIAGVPVELAVLEFIAGQTHLLRVDHHDIVAAIDVRREDRPM